jgi:ribokinase
LQWDVLGLGCVAVDDLLYLAEYPAPDTKVRVNRRERSCGGLTANALVAAARLGARCAFAGTLGDDEDSRFVRDCLGREGIDLSVLVQRPGARPIHSTILVEETHHTRTILFDLTGTIGASAEAPAAEVIRSARVLFVDHYGIEGMTRAAHIARQSGVAVVADLERDEWPGFAELLALVDHVLVSRDFALHLTGTAHPEQAVERLWTAERRVVVVTCGADGCWYRGEETGLVHQSAFAVPVADTTGCGDVFHGAYAAALAQGMPLAERIRFASAASALKATRAGGQAGYPTAAEVQRLLSAG